MNYYIKPENSKIKLYLPDNVYISDLINSFAYNLTLRFVGKEEVIDEIKNSIERFRNIPLEIGVNKHVFKNCTLSSWAVNKSYSEYSWIFKKQLTQNNSFSIPLIAFQSMILTKSMNCWIRSTHE